VESLCTATTGQVSVVGSTSNAWCAKPTLYHGGGWVWTQADAKGGPINEINWTYFVMAGDGTAWFVSFLGKKDDEERDVFNHLDSALRKAKQETTSWPSQDLFPTMGVGPVKSK
jgi:hypothetical protein